MWELQEKGAFRDHQRNTLMAGRTSIEAGRDHFVCICGNRGFFLGSSLEEGMSAGTRDSGGQAGSASCTVRAAVSSQSLAGWLQGPSRTMLGAGVPPGGPALLGEAALASTADSERGE